MDLRNALDHYLQSLENETTRINYGIILREFCQHFERLIDIDHQSILKFKTTLAGKSEQTIASRMSAIRSFLMYCWEHNWIPMDPSLTIRADNVQRYQNSKNITIEDFKNILSKTNVKTLAGLRDYLLLRLLFISGDIEKVLDLKIKSGLPDILDGDRKTFATMLAQQIPVEDLKNGYLFFGLEKMNCSQKMSLSGVRKILKKYCALAGLNENFLDFNAIKRLRARQIYEQTSSVEAVQKFCGHSSPTQTKTFLRTIFPEQKHF
jgi:site-specific recombinase XerD